MKKKRLRLLFIGNSHTYYHDMPGMVRTMAEGDRFECEVTMLAHPGWYLDQHVREEEARFNILFGRYDYVILQEHSHPFGPLLPFLHAATVLSDWIREAGSTPVIFATWAREEEPEEQERMNRIHREVAQEIGALLAAVGERWWTYKAAYPDMPMYEADGAHASPEGSEFAAKIIWDTILDDLERE